MNVSVEELAESKPAGDPSSKTSAPSRKSHRVGLTALGLFAVTLPFLLAGIGNPSRDYYDEGYYIPAARAFLKNGPNTNPQAPPLGKLLIAIGIKTFGDNPLGWRIPGAVCGSLSLVAIFCLSYLLCGSYYLACIAAALTFFNNFLFVMSRVAMMDVFLVFFLLWGLVAYVTALELDLGPTKRRFLMYLSGISMGLGAACKWNAVDTLAVLLLTSFGLFWASAAVPKRMSPSMARYTANLRRIGIPTVVLALVVSPILSYCLTFWPLCRSLHLPFGMQQLVDMNALIWRLHVMFIGNRYITSPWFAWPFNIHPQRALSYLVGNPVIMWGGLAALLFCFRRFWKFLSVPEGLVVLLYLANLLQWAVSPVKSTCYYYYYPEAMLLGVAIALALPNLPSRVLSARISFLVVMAAALVFVWCYPRMAHLEAPWDCVLGCWS
jgi:dolichyl-phosphate-mannose--protein O-mannosyl transferase